jgi:hypothetical protein
MPTALTFPTITGVTSAPNIPDLTEAANIQNALRYLYFGSTGSASTSAGIYGALHRLYVGDPTLAGNVTITGNLTVNGTTTTINSTTLNVDDKLIELGAVTTPTNTTADGGGLTLFGATNKSIIWDNANANWTTSENWNLTASKTLKINNVDIVSGTGAALILGSQASTSTTIGNSGGTVVLNSGTVLGSQSTQNLFNTVATTLNIGGAATSLSIGNTTALGQTVNMFTSSTAAQTINIATGATTGSSVTKALNIGTGAGASTITNITLGSSNGGTFAVNSPTVTLGSATALNINGASPSIATTNNGTATVFNTNALGLNLGNAATTASLVGSATTLSIGNTTTSSQTVNMFTAATAGGTYNIATAASSSGTKAINIGTGGTTGSTTTINIGTAGGTGTVNINGTANIGKVLLQTVTTSAGASTLTFSSIPQTYESIEVVYTIGTANVSATTVSIQFAGDTGGNYSYALQSQIGSAGTNTSAPTYANGFDQTSVLIPMLHPANTSIGYFTVQNYASTAGSKIGRYDGYYDYITDGLITGTFAWKNRTTAVTSMTLTFGGTVTGQVVTAQLFGLN